MSKHAGARSAHDGQWTTVSIGVLNECYKYIVIKGIVNQYEEHVLIYPFKGEICINYLCFLTCISN